MNLRIIIILLPLIMLFYDIDALETISVKEQSFAIGKNDFVMDGKPFRYISGSLHYFRVLPSSWRDRLRKMIYAGLNTVQTYTIWSSHEPEPGTYDFSGRFDLLKFLNIAQEEGLYVILRPGPYIDAEITMGGLPYWLLRENPKMKLRTFDDSYIKYVENWMTIILQKVKPLLYKNRGPIIMVQIENEYGSYGACDFKYTTYLRDLTKSILGDDVVLFTTDGSGANYLKCGKIPGVYATVDFGVGASINNSFEAQRLFEPEGPLINSEFYAGWLDHYGAPHSTVNSWILGFYLNEILALGASVNIYMMHGGTSFGTLAGSNIINENFLACPTSYDYDAPITEAGDLSYKYMSLREVIGKYADVPQGPVPPDSEKYSYGKVTLSYEGYLPHMLQQLPNFTSNEPKTFADVSVSDGLVAYQTVIKYATSDPSPLTFKDVRDRGYVFLDNTYVGMVSRGEVSTLGIYAKPNQTLTVIVESMGRVCFGEHLNDWKGIKGVTLSSVTLDDWCMIPLPLEYKKINYLLERVRSSQDSNTRMVFFKGNFNIRSTPKDTFLRQDVWVKGYVWINGFLLGRYWPAVGPQMTLYVPAEVLRKGTNSIQILELEAADCNRNCFVEFVSKPIINGPTPFYR